MGSPFASTQDLERYKRLGALLCGLVLGALTGAFVAAFALDTTFSENAGILLASGVLGALVGAAFSQGIAASVDLGPWEPLSAGRGYVGTHAPDEPGPT